MTSDEIAAAKEEWRPIPGFEGAYAVSSLGDVRRLYFCNGTKAPTPYLKPRPIHAAQYGKGYRRVCLYRDGKRKNYNVHCLVLEAFQGPRPSPSHDGAHLDGNVDNNSVENLAWVTRKENAAHRKQHGTQQAGEQCYNAKFTDGMVLTMRAMHALGFSFADIGRTFKCATEEAHRIVKGNSWRHLDGQTKDLLAKIRTSHDDDRVTSAPPGYAS